MTPHRWLLLFGLATFAPLTLAPATAQRLPAPVCAAPVLNRLTPHRTAVGETIASLAAQYRLFPESIQNFNPNLATGTLPTGITVLIPPYNGLQVNVPTGSTWRDLSEAYGIRADVLFELNGCQNPGRLAFIPNGRRSSAPAPSPRDRYEGLAAFPLFTQPAQVGLPYGWYARANQTETFHNGLDLLASVGTTVQAAAAGTVVFTGQEGDYGRLVVINHAQGRQTRYAHLDAIAVQMGQTVTAGQKIGTVGQTGLPDIPQAHLHFEVRQQAPVGWVAQDPKLHLQL